MIVVPPLYCSDCKSTRVRVGIDPAGFAKGQCRHCGRTWTITHRTPTTPKKKART